MDEKAAVTVAAPKVAMSSTTRPEVQEEAATQIRAFSLIEKTNWSLK